MQPASYTNGKYGKNRLLRQKGFELGTGQQAERLLSPAVDGRSKTGEWAVRVSRWSKTMVRTMQTHDVLDDGQNRGKRGSGLTGGKDFGGTKCPGRSAYANFFVVLFLTCAA
jgi:hypothetical protein